MHVRSDTVDARWRLIKDGEHVGHDGVTVMGERTWHLRRPEGQLDCQLTIVSPVLSQMHILLSPFSTTTNSLGHSELPSCSQTGFQNTPVPINASPQESTSPSPTSNPSPPSPIQKPIRKKTSIRPQHRQRQNNTAQHATWHTLYPTLRLNKKKMHAPHPIQIHTHTRMPEPQSRSAPHPPTGSRSCTSLPIEHTHYPAPKLATGIIVGDTATLLPYLHTLKWKMQVCPFWDVPAGMAG
jgi:hypothetical protein